MANKLNNINSYQIKLIDDNEITELLLTTVEDEELQYIVPCLNNKLMF